MPIGKKSVGIELDIWRILQQRKLDTGKDVYEQIRDLVLGTGQFTLLLMPMAGYARWWGMSQAGDHFTPTPRPTIEELDKDLARLEGEIRAHGKSAGA